MEENYESLKNRIEVFYPVRLKEQEKSLKKIWKYFNEDIAKLESIVRKDFAEAIKGIDLNGAEILDYRVKYNSKFKNLDIKITKLKLADGKIMEDNNSRATMPGCPHSYLAPICQFLDNPINPKIIEFKEKYEINEIRTPDNYCNHK